MKIAFITYAFPWPLNSGINLRYYHLIEQLTARHEVTLISLQPQDPPIPGEPEFPLRDRLARIVEINARTLISESAHRFNLWAPFPTRLRAFVESPLPARVNLWNSEPLIAALRSIRESIPFDAAWVDRSPFAEVARKAGFDRVVVDLADLDTISLFRELRATPFYVSKFLHYAEAAKLWRYERTLPERFWRVAVCKESDRRFLGKHHRNVFVVPNGMAEFPACDSANVEAGNLLYLGAMSYGPNVDAVQFFSRAILPGIRQSVPEAVFHIVGRDPAPDVAALHDPPGILVHGAVPEVSSYLARASVVVAPIRLGSGTRLKVLEALAHAKAMVATSMAMEGLDLRPGIDLEVADDPASFAAACVRLLGDPARRSALGAAGRARVLERYHWESIGKLTQEVLEPAPA